MQIRDLQERLQQALAMGRLAHGYIVVGPVDGEGQALAEWLGAQLLGASSTVKEHTHPDMPWFKPEKVSRIIDAKMMTERILPFAQCSSLSGGWKIPVIVSADRMNETSANAFLKILEEAPSQTLFLLLVDRMDELLPTIISRCQVLNVGGQRRLPEPWRTDVIEMLADIREKGVLLDTMRAERIVALLDEMDERAEKEVRAEAKAHTLLEEDADTLKARIGATAKAWRADLWRTIEAWMEDLIRLASTDGACEQLNFPECRGALLVRSKAHSLARLLANLSMLETMCLQLERNLTPAHILPYWFDRFYL
jgi:DNA polymerase-3 subunit delta'